MSEEPRDARSEKILAEAYDKMMANLKEMFATTSEITKQELDMAIKKVSSSFEGASRFTQEELDKLRTAVRKDWTIVAQTARDQKDKFIQSEQFQRIADSSLDILSRIAKSVKDWATDLDEKIDEQITYHTGEIAGAGTFECTNCGNHLHFKKSGRIPPCGKCKKTSFKRVFE